MKLTFLAIIGTFMLALSGCATLVKGSTQTVNVKTDPPGAICEVGYKTFRTIPAHWEQNGKQWVLTHSDGETLMTIMTPGIITLKRDNDYSVNCRLAGYKDTTRQINHIFANLDYLVLGNLLLTGFVPGFAVDYITGAANNLEPAVLNMQMTPPSLPGYVVPSSTAPVTQ